MKVILIGGPEHGRTVDAPSGSTHVVCAKRDEREWASAWEPRRLRVERQFAVDRYRLLRGDGGGTVYGIHEGMW